jgi:putative ubiquitin-RnfH superfamily antitoxin RatB of RatAB toxin-antitoxin module
MPKCCSVACDTAAGVLRCELQLPDAATVADALAAARQLLGDAGVNWDSATVGIFGQIVAHQQLLLDGDRVELLRPLPSDPRVARRARVAASRPQKRGARVRKRS